MSDTPDVNIIGASNEIPIVEPKKPKKKRLSRENLKEKLSKDGIKESFSKEHLREKVSARNLKSSERQR